MQHKDNTSYNNIVIGYIIDIKFHKVRNNLNKLKLKYKISQNELFISELLKNEKFYNNLFENELINNKLEENSYKINELLKIENKYNEKNENKRLLSEIILENRKYKTELYENTCNIECFYRNYDLETYGYNYTETTLYKNKYYSCITVNFDGIIYIKSIYNFGKLINENYDDFKNNYQVLRDNKNILLNYLKLGNSSINNIADIDNNILYIFVEFEKI